MVWDIDNTWTLFLDRDGVINKRIVGGYVTAINEFEFLPKVESAISELSGFFNKVIVVTNQQGIGKGIMTEDNLLEVHRFMLEQISLSGGKIDKCYFAPNIKGEINDMRKPNSKMAEMAKTQFPQINYSKSVMVGDTDSDIEFGKNLGMKTVRIKTEEPIGIVADLTVNSLFEFSKIVKNEI